MKQFRTILKFELFGYFKNKIFVGVTIFMIFAIAAVMFNPMLVSLVENENTASDEKKPVMLILCETNDKTENDEIIRAFSAAFTDYDVKLTKEKTDKVKGQITSGKAECAFVIKTLTSYDYYVNNLSLYDQNASTADAVLQSIYRLDAMTKNGISADEAGKILTTAAQHETINLGKNQMQNFFYTYIMIFALYMVILFYGQMVATNVATEKSSRAMELLITSARPESMMFGKVIASCIAGMLQLLAVFGSSYVFYNINKSYWKGNEIVASIFDMPLNLLVYMLVFFVLGFFVYAFLYGAIGSTASKLEDINTSVMPLSLLSVAGFMIVMVSMNSGEVDGTLMTVCSYLPFTSPMAMFTRIAMSTVPFYEIVISIAVLIASVVGIGILSAKIYRVGVLLYGTTPKIGAIFKAIRKA